MVGMSKISIALVVMIFLFAGIISLTNSTNSSSVNEFLWTGAPPSNADKIEARISQLVSPYQGIEYDNITLATSEKNNKIHIHATASTSASKYMDRYDFVYSDNEIIITGYILEAIPESVRSEAISLALQNEEVASAMGSGMYTNGDPFVKQILPETSEKFYTGKPLISVTWMDSSISALIDMDTRAVVQVWTG
ncbi:hypothetical protein V7O61_14745 [Methanolobus sp. WCC1]|uniref:hypothetical protein n=1 Tax=unclassified Methanolobus TaxID=2629569 RepID=UPI0032512712